MPSNFSSLRSSRKSLLDKLAAQAKQEASKGGGADERFWKLTVDAKTKIGYAKLRFLPAPKNEELPWVRLFSHAFQGPGGGWFIENCPTTLGRECPVCKENNKLWNSGVEADKDVARKRKRKLGYISNVLIIEDSSKAENNGKVFLFKYGAKIHDKIKELLEPEFPDATPANPFDLWEGADFKLKSRDQAGYQNYDKSEFAAPAPLFDGDDAKLEAVWEQEKGLAEFVAEGAFKSYEDLEKRLVAVLTGATRAPKTAEEALKREQATPEDAKDVAAAIAEEEDEKPTKKTKPAKKEKPVEKPVVPASVAGDDEDDEIKSFFAGIGDD